MDKAIVVLAGQSNASRISDEIVAALEAQYGTGNYVLVRAYSAGAPLTRSRDTKLDWDTPGELRETMVDETITALRENPGSYYAGTIWLQGEADTYGSSAAGNYAQDFVELHSEIQQKLIEEFGANAVGAETARVLVSNLSNYAPAAPTRGNWDAIRNAFSSLGALHEWVDTLDPDVLAAQLGIDGNDMFSDGLHYSDDFSPVLANSLVSMLFDSTRSPNQPRQGTNGDDIFEPYSGADHMIGGTGNDIYYVDHESDVLVELANEGTDHVYSSVHISLYSHSQHLENLTLTGSSDLDAKGNGQDNVIVGNSGDNVLNGARGDDTLDGGAGNDTFRDNSGADHMIGGTGDDIYNVDHKNDVLVELENEGRDHVYSSVNISLRSHSQHLENLTLTGSSDLDAKGNGQDNVIVGNSGDNVINGAWGDDTLYGGAGNDTFRDNSGADHMIGGTGDDIYNVDHKNDVLVELENEGTDHVYSSVNISLRSHSQHLENLTLTGSSDLDAIGNGLDNIIVGNSGDNVINGAWGDDTLDGGAGNDTFRDNSGADHMIGGAGSDIFIFRDNFGRDTIFDFNATLPGERIDLSGVSTIVSFEDLISSHIVVESEGVIIEDGLGNEISLRNVALLELTADNFLF